ncbi:thiazole synthase [Thalassobacillus pellis]|uniref:thiazole synthase n=1 Tax=Thalassobacillus pellis TaxID=748008 RepID=UPI001961F7F3|nr:thiazole synthase [Thalassobacillus pellis]MBM7553800.1 thiazole synthase [Thalassobacillus pellis]
MEDVLQIGGRQLKSRLLLGTGKFADHRQMKEAVEASQSEIVTVAVRRVDLNGSGQYILNDLPGDIALMPNTSGARTSEEAVRIARLAKAAGMGNWIKVEVISDQKYLLPDNSETLKTVEQLVEEGFEVFPYMSPDLTAGKRMAEAGAAAVMPLGAPIGSNMGIRMKDLIKVMVEEIDAPIIVDAGIGKPSQAAEAMEMGAAAVLVNTAIATAADPVAMARAFSHAVEAGRCAYLAEPGAQALQAAASSPLTGFLREDD